MQIVLRLSRPDALDPNKRRHFEISIDSPFNILSCRATQANTSLPAYASPESVTMLTDHLSCGCPGAPRRRNLPTALFPPGGAPTNPHPAPAPRSSTASASSSASSLLPTAPSQAHVHEAPNAQTGAVQRPMHLLRAPSFNPPAFSDEEPPPPLVTPPPRYETLVEGDPRGGLADYFSRLADEVGEDDEAVSMGARMQLPLTPGGRVNRSMDERRTWVALGAGVAG